MGLISLFILVVLVVGIPSTILYFLYKWLTKKGQKKIGVIILVAIFGFLTYSIYTAIYPSNQFYIDEFEINTGLEFPKSGKITIKDSNYPDQHGDYGSTAIIEFNKIEYEQLKTNIASLKNFQVDTTRQGIGITTECRKLTKGYSKNDFEIIYYNTEKEWFKVAFLRNKKTIIFERCSS